MFSTSRSLHRFLLMIACLLLLGSPAMAQETKNVIARGEGEDVDAPRVRRVLILHSLGQDLSLLMQRHRVSGRSLPDNQTLPLSSLRLRWRPRDLPKADRRLPSLSICALCSLNDHPIC